MTKTVVTPEMFAGNFVQEVSPKRLPDNKRSSGRLVRYVELTCLNCSTSFEVSLANAKRTQQLCCSRECSHKYVEAFAGGNEKHPLYSRWLSMRQRVYNPSCSNYKNYGLRGITIQDGLDVFTQYVKYVESLSGYSIDNLDSIQLDRINNDGNYCIGNLRWVARSTQLANQRKSSKGVNRYRGVCWSNQHNRWVARLVFNGVSYCSSVHVTELEALTARNNCILANNLPHPIQNYVY